MSSVLLSALAATGTAEHLVGVAAALRECGHQVSVVVGAGAMGAYRHLDVDLHPVPEVPMPDAPDVPEALPPVLQRARHLYARVQHHVIEPLPMQASVVKRIIRSTNVDAIVTDALFLGASMVSVLPRAERPAVIMLGAFPPWIPDPDVPPYGLGFPPSDTQANRARSAASELLTAGAYTKLSRAFNAQVEAAFGRPRSGDLRFASDAADAWAQLTVPRFEYPRRALPSNFRFVGPLRPPGTAEYPEWWDPTREPPVILVRANGRAAIRDLVLPTVDAFGDSGDVVVVVGATRAEVAAAADRPLPANVHFELMAPWPRLIPQRTVVVSDGDYVHTQHALRYGIPVVVAGTLESDVETAARLVWAGAGVSLKTRRPEAADIRAAVGRIRAGTSFTTAAAKIASQIESTDAEGALCDLVEEFSSVRR